MLYKRRRLNNIKVKRYNSNKLVSINPNKYRIDWNNAPSKGQQILQNFLYPYLKNHLVLKEVRIPGTLMRIDIVDCNTHICYEYSPLTHHNNYNEFFHKCRAGYLKSLTSDMNKARWINENGFKLVEIVEDDLNNLSLKYFREKFEIDII